MINYDAARGVAVSTAPGARTQSALTIRDAAPRHSGNYSCRAPNTEPAAIYVYVSEGSDKMAATLSRSRSPRCGPPLARGVALLLAAALRRRRRRPRGPTPPDAARRRPTPPDAARRRRRCYLICELLTIKSCDL
ncbi:uncharacterized protein [Choristoneura fumiferana]|uniref:uncharacterized protein n=1 Tax=Choristoneura fumiferana TaxID=7141 RepID=UPI003D15C17F